jgi:hypothetical protein
VKLGSALRSSVGAPAPAGVETSGEPSIHGGDGGRANAPPVVECPGGAAGRVVACGACDAVACGRWIANDGIRSSSATIVTWMHTNGTAPQ